MYEWGLSVQTVCMAQGWQTGLAIILCCVKLLEDFSFITCATFHGVLPWESQCFYWGCRQRFRDLFGVNSFCMGPSDLTTMCVPALSMESGCDSHRCSFTWAAWQRALQVVMPVDCQSLCYTLPLLRVARGRRSLSWHDSQHMWDVSSLYHFPCFCPNSCSVVAVSWCVSGVAPSKNDAAVLE